MGYFRYNQSPTNRHVEELCPMAKQHLRELYKMGIQPLPVEITEYHLTQNPWGQAWCRHIEFFTECKNRMSRGRSIVRQGGVCHLYIAPGVVEARISGSELYHVRTTVAGLPEERWDKLQQHCPIPCDRLLKQHTYGPQTQNFSHAMLYCMRALFPQLSDIEFSCDCPDGANLCKHIAATLYGVGVRLDETPTELFTWRGIDTETLTLTKKINPHKTAPIEASSRRREINNTALANLFDITLSDS